MPVAPRLATLHGVAHPLPNRFVKFIPFPALLLAALAPLCAADAGGAPALRLSLPLDYQVGQRDTAAAGTISVAGALPQALTGPATIETRLTAGAAAGRWEKLATLDAGQTEFRGEVRAPAGGWYQLDVRARQEDSVAAEAAVGHVGVGEVFVIAGQSNSANHGAEKQTPRSGLVSAFDGTRWQPASDPQPGASGSGGSFLPPFGDALAARFKVPIGLVATGAGGTSVREWLPRGARFAQPPTVTGHVTQLPSGEWEAKGTLFAQFTARLRPLGPHGFRAVLWHQGESDANQRDPACTLPGELYRAFLAQLIRDSRRELGWNAPWFIAQASYHAPDDPGSPDIRAAQKALWETGLALPGPDTDTLTGDLREGGGQGIHFSGPGLHAHAALWVEKVAPWLEQQLANPAPLQKK